VDDICYDAWGERLSGGAVAVNQYLYTGEQYDAGLGKVYLRARYYSSGTGRFSQMDEWLGHSLQPISLNKFNYADGDPLLNYDPTGNFSLSSISTANAARGALTTVKGLTYVGYIGKAIRAAFIGTGVLTLRFRLEVRKCRRSQGKRCLIPNLVVNGSDYPESMWHISDAQKGKGSNGIPITCEVTYKKGGNGKSGWYKNLPECKGKTGGSTGMECDEYPFFTTKEGGLVRYRSNQVSLRPICGHCNAAFGINVWGGAVRRVKTGKKLVVATGGPLSFYFVNGTFGTKQ